MTRRWLVVPLLAATALLNGCNEDTPATFDLRVLHASPDAPPVNVSLNGAPLVENLDYKQGTGWTTRNVGSYHIVVDALLPGGNTSPVLDLPDTTFDANTAYTVLAVGKVADENVDTLVLTRARGTPAAGDARLQIVHAAPGAPQVDVYVTAPGGALDSAGLVGTLSFKEDTGTFDRPAGDYEIRVTPAGDNETVVFDSGTVSLAAGADFVIAVVVRTGAGTAPVSLVVLNGGGTAQILDVDTPADVRVVHASPDTPAIDVVTTVGDVSATLVSDLAYAEVAPSTTSYLPTAPDSYDLTLLDHASLAPIPSASDPVTLDASAGSQTTVLVTDLLAGIQVLTFADDHRRVATEAKLRLFHGAPGAGDVDIYVVPTGTDIATASPTFSAVALGGDTGYLGLDAGTYDVKVTATGTTTVAISTTITVATSGVYTAVARDAPGGGAPFDLILLDDLD